MRQTVMMAVALSLALPTVATAETMTIKGSDTMVILGQRWAETFMKANPGTQIQVTGGGSGTGISALINGTTDICQSSREMKQSEKDKMRERYNRLPAEIPVAKDGVTIYVRRDNPVGEITKDQLRAVYTGEIANWKDLGGPDAKITVYGRENSSGTYGFFKEVVLEGKDFSPRVQTLPGTAAIVNAVSKDSGSIGYGGAAYAKGVKALAVKKTAADKGVLPDEATIRSGAYALSRNLFFYLNGPPTGKIKAFVDWVLTPAGQSIVKEVGYFPLK